MDTITSKRIKLQQHIKTVMHTAIEGEGQQCNAAPACTASTELEAKGSLEISALTKSIFLKNKFNRIYIITNHNSKDNLEGS